MKIKRRNSRLKGKRVHGFLKRMSRRAGRRVISARRRKGRRRLTTV